MYSFNFDSAGRKSGATAPLAPIMPFAVEKAWKRESFSIEPEINIMSMHKSSGFRSQTTLTLILTITPASAAVVSIRTHNVSLKSTAMRKLTRVAVVTVAGRSEVSADLTRLLIHLATMLQHHHFIHTKSSVRSPVAFSRFYKSKNQWTADIVLKKQNKFELYNEATLLIS